MLDEHNKHYHALHESSYSSCHYSYMVNQVGPLNSEAQLEVEMMWL
uniref:Uncharacterized protein n=1 Tax=Arundo donax TaxID=35708 RepID=A0A0A9HUC5_ARUDO